MGNIGSQTGHSTHTNEEQWTNSFPRNQQRLNHPKVIPEPDARQKLRHTNNGEILQSGGTLSGRYHQDRLSVERNDTHRGEEKQRNNPKTYLLNQRDPLHRSKNRYYQNDFGEQIKKFGSEPNLHQMPYTQTVHEDNDNKKMRMKKKYKAPPPPPNHSAVSSLDWEDNSSAENGSSKKTRMFKTRIETKRYYSSPVNNRKSLDYDEEFNNNQKINKLSYKQTNRIETAVEMREERNKSYTSNRLSLPESKILPNIEFHQELKEVTKRLKCTKMENSDNNDILNKDDKQKLKTLDHNINKRDNIRMKFKQMSQDNKQNSKPINECVRGEGSGKESSSPENLLPRITNVGKTKDTPKTFYFGMGETLPNDDYANDMIDHFAANLHPINHLSKIENSSESDLSSELELDENQAMRNGIDLQLRPILPKKQLEIPRFSPAAAWKLLSAVDSNPIESTIASDDAPVFIEDRIEKYSRPPPPTIQIGPRSSNDKSGDSGISGDAGPVGFDDSPDPLTNSRGNLQLSPDLDCNQGISWTPQQDLGDDSSIEDINLDSPLLRHTNKPHVFSLSLPRDNQLASYANEKYIPSHTSLQKLKRSVSGVFNNLNRREFSQPNSMPDQGDNWFLSKSAPNSLNTGLNSLETRKTNKSDDNSDQLINQSAKQNSGRLMYLPDFDEEQSRHMRSRVKGDSRVRSKSAERVKDNNKLSLYSKSCENLSAEVKLLPEPKNLQDPPKENDTRESMLNKKRKRFTFQSTVRQIERKKLAEKLSREAEKKEQQRLRELEAMQKVEEEFQKKRAKEKANIRQQLRLFSMDDNAWSSLPPNLDLKDEMPIRPDPDGAVSSSTSSPSFLAQPTPEILKKSYQKNRKASDNSQKYRPSSESSDEARIKTHVTQILSEYQHPRREYKEYRGKYEFNENHPKQTTVHPQVTCNMPKARGQSSNVKTGTNYRKDFAHGIKSSSRSAGSSYSDGSQSKTDSPRTYHSKYSPITRF